MGYPPGIPPSNSKNRLFGPKMGPFLGPWRGPGGGPGGRPGGGPAGGPRGAPGGARGGPPGGPPGGPWRGSWRGSRRGRRLGPSWTPVWGHLRWRMHQGLPANQMHVVMPQSSDTLMAALRSTLATGLATPCRPMLGDPAEQGGPDGPLLGRSSLSLERPVHKHCPDGDPHPVPGTGARLQRCARSRGRSLRRRQRVCLLRSDPGTWSSA